MIIEKSEVLLIRSEPDVVLVRQAVRIWATELQFGFRRSDQDRHGGERNRPQHAGLRGWRTATLEIVRENLRRGLRICFETTGPGIPDIERALTNGFTTGGSLGLGFGGAKRLVNEFYVESKLGGGHPCHTYTLEVTTASRCCRPAPRSRSRWRNPARSASRRAAATIAHSPRLRRNATGEPGYRRYRSRQQHRPPRRAGRATFAGRGNERCFCGVEILALDKAAPHASVSQCLEDGFSTGERPELDRGDTPPFHVARHLLDPRAGHGSSVLRVGQAGRRRADVGGRGQPTEAGQESCGDHWRP
jgi:serine/threonine-protein kinase RsbT